MDLFAQNIMDHYKNPRNKKRLEKPTSSSDEANYSCGDTIVADIIVDNDIVTHITFDGGGCSISQAAMSILTEHLKGKTIEEVLALTEKELIELLGIPINVRRRKCALLGLLSIKNAILKYQGKDLLKWIDLSDDLDEE